VDSPRKSSTSSGKANPSRPRYLGIEVAGTSSFRTSPPWWQSILSSFRPPARAPPPFRIVRFQHDRAIVEVGHRTVPAAREAWNATVEGPDGRSYSLRTVRSWGTLVGAKAWLQGEVREPPTPPR
jgi:hypothetical protein